MPQPRIHIDFETRSQVDLKKAGVDRYAEDPSTDVWCLCFAIDDSPVEVWCPGHVADELAAYTSPRSTNALDEHFYAMLEMIRGGATVIAHNASFEQAIWEHVMPRYVEDLPPLKIENISDTMVRAYALALPGSLAQAAQALQLPIDKDEEGRRLMMRMARPRKVEKDGTVTWWNEPERVARLVEYCKVDVEVERQIDHVLPELSERERILWHLDYRINHRGLTLDKKNILRAQEIVHLVTDELNGEMSQLTGGKVTKVSQAAKLKAWVLEQTYNDGSPMDVTDLAKTTVANLLLRKDIRTNVRRVLEIRRDAGKASTAKLKAMLASMSSDDRARFLLAFHVATTGRWAGRRVQPQNMPRPNLKQYEIEAVICALRYTEVIDVIKIMYGPPVDVIASCLRAMMVPAKGLYFIGCDFSNIEGRVLAWLAGEDWKLEAFRDYDTVVDFTEEGEAIRKGPDLYMLAYARAFGIDISDVTDKMRQLGKVMELALGYQGGVGAFASMAAIYSIHVIKEGQEAPEGAKEVLLEEETDEIKTKWRKAHPNVVNFWYECERLAVQAAKNPGKRFVSSTGRITYIKKGSFLFCRLPSGRVIAYPSATVRTVRQTKYNQLYTVASLENNNGGYLEEGQVIVDGWVCDVQSWNKEQLFYWGVDAYNRKWSEQKGYGGLLVENVTQAVARDILADSLLALEAAGHDVVLHVHDEALIETDTATVEEIEELMVNASPWAAGMPIAAEGWKGTRYQK